MSNVGNAAFVATPPVGMNTKERSEFLGTSCQSAGADELAGSGGRTKYAAPVAAGRVEAFSTPSAMAAPNNDPSAITKNRFFWALQTQLELGPIGSKFTPFESSPTAQCLGVVYKRVPSVSNPETSICFFFLVVSQRAVVLSLSSVL